MSLNIYWKDALRSGVPVVRRLRTWTCGDATVFWHGQESREAQSALRAVEVSDV